MCAIKCIVLSALLASTVYARTCDHMYIRTYIYAYTCYPVYHTQVFIHIQLRACATHTHARAYIRRGDIHNRRRHGYGPFVPGYRRLISMSILTRTITCHSINEYCSGKTATRIISHLPHAESLIVGPVLLMCNAICRGPSHDSTHSMCRHRHAWLHIAVLKRRMFRPCRTCICKCLCAMSIWSWHMLSIPGIVGVNSGLPTLACSIARTLYLPCMHMHYTFGQG